MSTNKLKLDKEEKEILDAIEGDNVISTGIKKSELDELKKIAKNTLAKTRTISIRISERDLIKLKAMAAEEGLPYQTLISSTLHKKTRTRSL